jgi:hypothetical protein
MNVFSFYHRHAFISVHVLCPGHRTYERSAETPAGILRDVLCRKRLFGTSANSYLFICGLFKYVANSSA